MYRWVSSAVIVVATTAAVIGIIQAIQNPEIAPQWLGAAATFGLLGFAAVQIVLDRKREEARDASARAHLSGPAWLARRTMEAVVRKAQKIDAPLSILEWATSVRSDTLDRLEQQMLEVLRLSAQAGGEDSTTGFQAFEAFLGAADRINEIPTLPWTEIGPDYRRPGADTEQQWVTLHGGAMRHLRKGVKHLEHFAERMDHEPSLPKEPEHEDQQKRIP